MNFGEKLQFSQADFWKKIGVSARTVHLYERGLRYPKTRKTYQKLVKEIECDYNYFLDEEGEFCSYVKFSYKLNPEI